MGKFIWRIIKEWKKESGSWEPCLFKLDSDGTLYLYTSRPGLYIGLHGELIDKYTSKLKEEFSTVKEVKFVQTDGYWV